MQLTPRKNKCYLYFSFARDVFYSVLQKDMSILKSLCVKATILSFYIEQLPAQKVWVYWNGGPGVMPVQTSACEGPVQVGFDFSLKK